MWLGRLHNHGRRQKRLSHTLTEGKERVCVRKLMCRAISSDETYYHKNSTHTHIHTHTHTHTCTYSYTHIHTHTHTHTLTRAHTHNTHTHSQSHAHRCSQCLDSLIPLKSHGGDDRYDFLWRLVIQSSSTKNRGSSRSCPSITRHGQRFSKIWGR